MTLNFPSDPGAQTPVNTYGPDSTPLSTDNGVTYFWDGDRWVASTAGSGDARYVNVTGDTMTGNLTIPSLNGGPLAGLRNKLINSDYAISQRYASYPWTATGVVANNDPKTAFGPDRWGTPQSREFQSRSERPSNAFPGCFQWRTGTQTNAVWSQVIELLSDGSAAPRNDFLLDCDNWTVSHWIFAADRNNFVCDIEYVNTSYSPSINQLITSIADGDWKTVETQGDWIRVAASFSMVGVAAAPAGALGVRVQFRNDGNIRAVGAQFEPGIVCTPLEHRPIAQELSLCQRYYNAYTGTASAAPMAYNRRNDDRYRAYTWQFPTTMRGAPTVTGSTSIATDSFSTASCPEAALYELVTTTAAVGGSARMTNLTADAEL